jgi:hypothetical protein
MNLISGNREISSRPSAFSLFLPGSSPNTRDRRRVQHRRQVAGSCNAILRRADGTLLGDMFDGAGFIRGLKGDRL